MLEKLDLRAGDNRGRIYRILPKQPLHQAQQTLASMTPSGLVEELNSPNQWRRMTAQRLIVENNHLVTTAPLENLVQQGTNAIARVQALWTLQGLGELGDSVLLKALNDPEPRVVENAVQVAAAFIAKSTDVHDRVQALALHHPDPRVRFLAAACSELSTDAVARFLRQDGRYSWSRLAALSALRGGEHMVLVTMLAGIPEGSGGTDPAVFRELAELTGARGSADSLGIVLEALARTPPGIAIGVLEGVHDGLARRPSPPVAADSDRLAAPLEALAGGASLDFRRTVWALERQLGLPDSPSKLAAMQEALKQAPDGTRTIAARVSAIELLTLAPDARSTTVLLNLFNGTTPVEIQRAALNVLRQPADLAVATGLLDRWREIHPTLKHEVTQLLLGKRNYHAVLLDALEAGRLKLGELSLDLEDRRRLISWSTPEIQQRARKLIGDGEYGNRQAKVEDWLARLPSEGNATKGRAVFEKTCAQCHRVGGLGQEVGPNLTGVSHRSVEDLVSNILDPNMAINPNYLSVAVETKGGELLSGILVAETADAITLNQAQGIHTTLRRDQIARMETPGTSLMPEGLEATMQPADLRDLVAFLQESK
jgi:putative heme-binding domain-containing protein